jgi:hypothetical protein
MYKRYTLSPQVGLDDVKRNIQQRLQGVSQPDTQADKYLSNSPVRQQVMQSYLKKKGVGAFGN